MKYYDLSKSNKLQSVFEKMHKELHGLNVSDARAIVNNLKHSIKYGSTVNTVNSCRVILQEDELSD